MMNLLSVSFSCQHTQVNRRKKTRLEHFKQNYKDYYVIYYNRTFQGKFVILTPTRICLRLNVLRICFIDVESHLAMEKSVKYD